MAAPSEDVPEVHADARTEYPADDTIPKVVTRRMAADPNHVGFRIRRDDGWHDATDGQFLADMERVAAGLIGHGVMRGDRVAVMSRTRYEWTVLDIAIMAAGAVTVPIYETSSAEQVLWILRDSGSVAVIVETGQQSEVVEGLREELPDLRSTWRLESDGLGGIAVGAAPDSAEQLQARLAAGQGSDLATVVYTSGTTGPPKGCPLTHANMLAVAAGVLPDGFDAVIRPDRSTLVFLPLAHVAARTIQTGCLLQGSTMGHWSDTATLVDELATFRPDYLVVVPRVLQKVYNAAATKAAAEGKGRIFDLSAATAIAYSRSMDIGGPSLALKLRHAVFDRLVYRKLRARLGGRVTACLCGAAPLGARLGHFFRGIGIPIYEVYGMTEDFGLATFNEPGRERVGSVGQPIRGGSIRIAADGEVLIGGPHVFDGYWHLPEATLEALPGDGWLHSGDVGELDGQGYLFITGRKKDLIVTASGKNVAPAVLEDRARAHPLIAEILVVGDARPFVGALVTLDPEYVATWLQLRHRPAGTPIERLTEDPEIITEVQAAIDAANAAVSRAESIRSFRILPGQFTVDGGQLTPSMKMRRSVVARENAEEIESIYVVPPRS